MTKKAATTAEELQGLARLAAHLAEVAWERELAFKDRKVDNERWQAAKQAYADERRFWRKVEGRA